MAISLARRNIVIFFISMSLVILLALGVYASNRLLTNWLLVRSLEHTFIAQKHLVGQLLRSLDVTNGEAEKPELNGLRLSRQDTGNAKALSSAGFRELKDIFRFEGSTSFIRDAAVVFQGSANAATARGIEWQSPETNAPAAIVGRAVNALDAGKVLTAIPDVSWYGKFGASAVIAFHMEGSPDSAPGLIVLVNQTTTLNSIGQVIWSISAAIGGLCLASFVFAGILLWMRFHDQVRTNRNIQYLAHHDTLTGLPNRAVFNARLNEALRIAQARASNIGVILIDVDKFKAINDTYGHGIGDVFLQIVGERLKAVFGNHLVARLSGDEFAVLLTSFSDPARMTRLASDMIAAAQAPCVIEGKEIKLSLSMGIARATDGSWRASRLLHCADLALYRSKHNGRSTFSWYTPDLDAEAKKRKEVETGLLQALEQDRFNLLYQPQYSLRDGKLTGYEALIRWEHPENGVVNPDVFIPIAEETGLIQDIGNWVLNNACKEAARWPDKTRRLAVNVSPAQFVSGETHKRVAEALEISGLDPARLEIEITENLLISDTGSVIETLRKIHEMGVTIAMDDFGTGYSSLSYLSLFPFDKIKIDKAFIQNLGKGESSDAIVTSIVGLGRSLDVTITAEGVETEEQAILLSAAGCDLVQGYMFGKPDTVAKHEANYPAYPLNPTGGLWFKQPRRNSKSPRISLAPKLAQYATLVSSSEQARSQSEPAGGDERPLKTAG